MPNSTAEIRSELFNIRFIGLLGGGVGWLARDELTLEKLPQVAIKPVSCLAPPRSGPGILEGSAKF